MTALSHYPSGSISATGVGPEKPLGEGVRELASGIVPRYQALERLEMLAMELLHVFYVEAFAVLTKMGATAKFFDELYGGRIVCFESVGVVANNVDPSRTSFSAGAYERAIVACRCESHLE